MKRMYGGRATGTAPGSLRLTDTVEGAPSTVIDCASLNRGELFVVGALVPVSYPVARGSVGIELSGLTVENVRDLRDEFQSELDRRLGL
jgi:hypothetical protein